MPPALSRHRRECTLVVRRVQVLRTLDMGEDAAGAARPAATPHHHPLHAVSLAAVIQVPK